MIGGGAGGRNCCPLSSTNGVIVPQLVNTGAGKFGGVGRYWPGWVPGTNGGGVTADPSVDRRSTSKLATLAPTWMPCCLPGELGMAASSVASIWSISVFWAG